MAQLDLFEMLFLWKKTKRQPSQFPNATSGKMARVWICPSSSKSRTSGVRRWSLEISVMITGLVGMEQIQ